MKSKSEAFTLWTAPIKNDIIRDYLTNTIINISLWTIEEGVLVAGHWIMNIHPYHITWYANKGPIMQNYVRCIPRKEMIERKRNENDQL